MTNKAVFLDRDGVINEIVYHREMGILDSPANPDEIKLLPDVGKAINKFKNLGFKVIIISNQPGIAKDKFTIDAFEKMKEKVRDELKKQEASVDGEYYCLHHPDGKNIDYKIICECRKPKPGLILQAAKEQDIDLSSSWMIGDGVNDIQAGQTAGCKTILLGRMKCDLCELLEVEGAKPDFIAPNLFKASLIIEEEERM
ncbi:MAG: HAD family hydrolase [Thermoplasmatales archaeon]|nr:HAD family hydrolase [Thermoplasmatales archaeon]